MATRAAREKKARFDELFARLDTNHDGYLSREELRWGLNLLAHPDLFDSTAMVYGKEDKNSDTKSKKSHHFDKFRGLTKKQQDVLVARAFETQPTRSTQADRDRISKETFQKIVIGPDGLAGDVSDESDDSTVAVSTEAPPPSATPAAGLKSGEANETEETNWKNFL